LRERMPKWKRYTLRLTGNITVTACSEEDARRAAGKLVGDVGEDCLVLIGVEEAPKCRMEKCGLYQKFSIRNPAGCVYYKDGICHFRSPWGAAR